MIELWDLSWDQFLPSPTPAAQSGVIARGPGMAPVTGGWGHIIVLSLLGMFGGMIAGYMASNVARYVAYARGRQITGYSWVIYGALAGGALCTWLAVRR